MLYICMMLCEELAAGCCHMLLGQSEIALVALFGVVAD